MIKKFKFSLKFSLEKNFCIDLFVFYHKVIFLEIIVKNWFYPVLINFQNQLFNDNIIFYILLLFCTLTAKKF